MLSKLAGKGSSIVSGYNVSSKSKSGQTFDEIHGKPECSAKPHTCITRLHELLSHILEGIEFPSGGMNVAISLKFEFVFVDL